MAAKSKVKRIAQHYKLGGDQSTFEFVDVALNSDSPFFLDPRAFHTLRSDWGEHCVSLLQTFFDAVMNRIRTGDHDAARQLLSSLNEPNETHLGLSQGRPAGRGMGKGLAEDMWEALSTSGAAATGLLQDLEDTVLFIDGIGHDRVSDITTNIVRGPLIEFTQDVANFYGIPLVKDVATSRCWNSESSEVGGLVRRPAVAEYGAVVAGAEMSRSAAADVRCGRVRRPSHLAASPGGRTEGGECAGRGSQERDDAGNEKVGRRQVRTEQEACS